ncbi:MAG: sulfotransferase family protein [Phenylobacterium sp.]|nr:sulfotransferase family protein [Phenylobacterium sp.]
MLASGGAPAAWLALVAASLTAEGALAACDAGLRMAPDHPDLICAKADVLRALGYAGQAEALLRRVADRQPDHGSAAFGLALLAVEAGDWAEADRRARTVRQAQPGRPDLQWLNARIALGTGDLERARGDLQALVDGGQLTPPQRGDALLLLGEALDGLGERPAAFEAAAGGKAIQRRLHAGQAAAREDVVARLRRLEAWFRGADPAAWASSPAAPAGADRAAGHVFLVGFPRSGTTLLEQALAAHPQVRTLEEAPTLAAAHDEFLTSPAGLERLARLSPAEARTWRARYWSAVESLGVEVRGRVFLDKAPAATEDLPLVAKLFPRAKVLFALRDPRDVVLSCLRQNFRMNAMTYAFTDLATAADCYDACFRLAEVYRELLPLDLIEVRHEALVDDLAGGLAAICAFLDLPFDPAMTDVGATARARAVRTPSAPQVRAGLNRQGLGRWRGYAQALSPVLPRLQPWAQRFGYEP